MRRMMAIGLFMAWCVSVSACAVRARRPEGPYREAEEFADALSDHAVACTREHPPQGAGFVVVVAEFASAGQAPIIHDTGSMAGSEQAIACVRGRASERLRSPNAKPAPFVRIRVPVPLVTSEVTYAFLQELPKPP